MNSKQQNSAADTALVMLLNQLRQLYGAGRHREILLLLARELAARQELPPTLADAFNIAGAAAMQLGEAALCERYWRQAIALNPSLSDPPNNLSLLLMRLGRAAEAEALLGQWLQRAPQDVRGHFNLASLWAGQGRHAESCARLRLALEFNPGFVEAWNSLGVLLMMQGLQGEAEAALRQTLLLRPGHAEANNNLGVLLLNRGAPAEAEACFRQALVVAPGYAEAGNNLGSALRARGELAQAEAVWRRLLLAQPGLPDACLNLAALLRDRQGTEEAEALYRQVLTLKPDHAEAYNGLGLLYTSADRINEAETAFRTVVRLAPGHAQAWGNLAKLLRKQQRFAEADAAFQQTLALSPDDGGILSAWYSMRRELCDWGGIDALEQSMARLLDSGDSRGLVPFWLFVVPGLKPAWHRLANRQFAEAQAGSRLHEPELVTRGPQPRGRLRIGYLSSDFQAHATVYLLAGVLERHDREGFEVSLYSYGPDVDSPERRRLQAACGRFRQLHQAGDHELAAAIAADGIDILVDLKGHTWSARQGVTALRPAPVLVNWLGYPDTLGHERLADYLIGDAVVTPLAHAAHFSETLALLPGCYQPNDRERVIGPRPSRAECGLPEQGLVFCNFNQSYKTSAAQLGLWCRLLAAVPGSVLWLLQPPAAEGADNLRRAAAGFGLDPERLILAPPLPQTEHLGRLQLADLALDTWPCASHTTASDALWVGVPMLARLGETLVSRVAASVVLAAGLPELVCRDDEGYFAAALGLATEPGRLAALRQRLAEQRLVCSLFDTARYTRELEALYRRIWDQECRGERQALPPLAVG